MTVNESHNEGQSHGADRTLGVEFIRRLKQFDGSGEQFLANVLAVQCFLGPADGGVFLRDNKENGIGVLAAYPELEAGSAPPEWLSRSAEIIREHLDTDTAIVKPLNGPDELYGQPAAEHIVIVPVTMAETGEAVAAFLIRTDNAAAREAACQRLELLSNLLSLTQTRSAQQGGQTNLARLHKAMETLLAVNQHRRFRSAAMALCNEMASRWQCERVSVGFLKGRYVQLKAMSHTEDFSRKMKLVQDIEFAMEECLDQDIEIGYPAPAEAVYVTRATGELARQYGPLAILSLPLRRNGKPTAVLTLERKADKPFSLEETETIRLTCELCTAGLASLYEHDRWFGARAAANARTAIGALIGPKHTWAKVAVVLGLAVIAFLLFAKGEYRAEASFVLEASYQQIVPAPFDGYIKSVEVEIGDAVKGTETVLAELDTAELRLRLAAAKAEKVGYLKQAAAAMRDAQTAQAQIAQADADKIQAQIELLGYLINQAKIISPISGTVVKGDLKRQIGAPVKTGDVLFEVTPLESLRAELLMPEEQIFDVKAGQKGRLATASYPAQRIEFEVERINPVAEVINNRNVFKVRVHLLETRPWMRPGMEGVAKVSVGKRRYVWIWTRKIVNWIRMKLWL